MSESRIASKKLRFEVFKRDGFTCLYCGRTPPAVTLQADHILPASKGGKTTLDNLATSCADCNAGKSSGELKATPAALGISIELAAERRSQLLAYRKLLQKLAREKQEGAEHVSGVYTSYFKSWRLSPMFVEGTLKSVFMCQLPQEEIEEAMHIACSRIHDADRAIAYFCGVCWQKIRNRNPRVDAEKDS